MKVIDKLLGILSALLHKPPPPPRPSRVAIDAAGKANLARIDHIVVVMMENRSFDHMLGYLKLENILPEVDGLTPGMANDYNGQPYDIHHLTDTFFPGQANPSHGGGDVDQQLTDGNGGFVRDFAGHNPGIDPGLVMG